MSLSYKELSKKYLHLSSFDKLKISSKNWWNWWKEKKEKLSGWWGKEENKMVILFSLTAIFSTILILELGFQKILMMDDVIFGVIFFLYLSILSIRGIKSKNSDVVGFSRAGFLILNVFVWWICLCSMQKL